MKTIIKKAIVALTLAVSAARIASAQTSDQLTSTNDVVTKMIQSDAVRQSQMTGYTALRHYVAVNKKRRAEMLVRVASDRNGSKQFSIVSEEGSHAIRNHVFYKLLSEETEASRDGTRNGTRLTPANYDFQSMGQEKLETGPAYVLRVTPKTANKYLIDGKIWVDANDYSIVRVEGQPARNPSFWVRSVHFVHTYQKIRQFWLASSTVTKSEIRIFGDSELTIENSDYTLNPQTDNVADAGRRARLNP
jgi:outer membrane lipoprotein-sorting protein